MVQKRFLWILTALLIPFHAHKSLKGFRASELLFELFADCFPIAVTGHNENDCVSFSGRKLNSKAIRLEQKFNSGGV